MIGIFFSLTLKQLNTYYKNLTKPTCIKKKVPLHLWHLKAR